MKVSQPWFWPCDARLAPELNERVRVEETEKRTSCPQVECHIHGFEVWHFIGVLACFFLVRVGFEIWALLSTGILGWKNGNGWPEKDSDHAKGLWV